MKNQIIVETDRAFEVRKTCRALFSRLNPAPEKPSKPPQPASRLAEAYAS